MTARKLGAAMLVGVLGTSGASMSRADHLPPVDPIDSFANHAHEDHRGHSHAGESIFGTDLTSANFDGVDLSGAHLGLSDLTGASLVGADLPEAALDDVTFTGADLSNATLEDALYLTSAQLVSMASVVGADLGGQTFFGADLDTIDLTNTDLRRVDLRGTDLSAAGGLDLATADSRTWYDANTTLPPGFDPVAAGWYTPSGSNLYDEPALMVSNLDAVPGGSSPGSLFGDGRLGLICGGASSLNGLGDIAFRHNSGFSDFSYGVFETDGTTVGAVARAGDSAPAGVGVYAGWQWNRSPPEINDAGDVFFYRRISGGLPDVDSGLFAVGPSGDRIVALDGDPAPGAPGDEFVSFQSCLGANASGDVAFSGRVALAAGGLVGGVFRETAGVITSVFAFGDVAPGTGGGTFVPYSLSMCPDINDSGDVVSFVSVLSGGTLSAALYVDVGGVKTPIAFEGDPAPGTGGGTFSSFAESAPQPMVRINDADDVVFRSEVAGGTATQGLFMASGGSIRAIALDGQIAPGTGGSPFESIWSPRLNASGDVVFYASFDGGDGIFVERAGNLFAVALSGESAPASIGGSFLRFGWLDASGGISVVAPPDLNDAGTIAFSAFIGGSTAVGLEEGILTVPEPSLAACLFGGAGALGLLARRRRVGRALAA